jgi:exopolysaccharide biosynthesis polyprenyl glycosylphosphotransferase
MFRRVSIRVALLLGDITLIPLALFLASWLRSEIEWGRPLPQENIWLPGLVYLMVLLVWGSGFLLLDVYNLPKNLRIIDELQRLVAAQVVTSLAFAGLLYFSFRNISRLQVLFFAFIGLFLLIGYRLLLRFLLHLFGATRYGSRRVLIVGAGLAGREAARMVTDHSWTGLNLVGFVDDDPDVDTNGYPHLGRLDQTKAVVQSQQINEVIFTLPRAAHGKFANLAAELQALQVNVRVVPDFFDLVFIRSVIEDFGGMPLITLREPALNPLQRFIKRCFDFTFSFIALLFVLPLMAIIAIIIKYDSPGPIIFRQQRVGENGRIFSMYKFRTMVHDAEAKQEQLNQITADGNILHKFYDDPRVTRVGRFLRQFSLDELPQLVNILQGEMSLVGPRPELPWLVDRYEAWQHKRFEVPQGLTGWWQINGRSDKPMHLHTEEDLYYIKNYSLWFDIQILWRTVRRVLDRRGAY